MKKYLSIIAVFLLSFFFFGFKVNAANLDINFDNNEHFNFFYEMKEDTPFYRFLVGQGDNLFSSLKELYNPSFNNYHISIFYADDLQDDSGIMISDPFVFPEGSKYVIMLETHDPGYIPFVSHDSADDIFYIHYPDGGYNIHHDYTYYVFDEDAHFLTYLARFSREKILSSYDHLTSENLEYVLSEIMYSSSDLIFYNYDSSSKLNIRVNKVIIDDTEYLLSSDNWLSNIWTRINSLFTGVSILKDSGYDLEFFRKNYVIGDSLGFPGLTKSLSNSGNQVSIPVSYESKSFSLQDQLDLYPVSSCSVNDIALYIRTTSSDDFYINLYELFSNDQMSYQASYYAVFKSVPNVVFRINPLRIYDTEGNLVNLTSSDFIRYSYRFWRETNFDTYTVYYNPDCYSSVYINDSLEWTNPNSGNTITISPDYGNWSDPENVNAGNSVNFLDSNFDADDLLQKGWSGAGSFVSAANTIVSLTFSLFNEMPAEMQALLFTFFAIGLVLIILKIFL